MTSKILATLVIIILNIDLFFHCSYIHLVHYVSYHH